MPLTFLQKKLEEARRHSRMNQKKLYPAFEKELNDQDKCRSGSFKKQPTVEEKRQMLWAKISELYHKKSGMDEGPEKRKLRVLIDDTIVNWNVENHPFGFFDLHWMTPNGAAAFVVRTVNEVLERNAGSVKKNGDGFRKELSFVVGMGKHSVSEVVGTLKKEVCFRLGNHPRRDMFTWKTLLNNGGIVVVRFK